MTGKNVLWVSKQHGHSITTMLRAYAAWTEGAVEADLQAIERSMKLTPRQVPLARPPRHAGTRVDRYQETKRCARWTIWQYICQWRSALTNLARPVRRRTSPPLDV